MSPPGGGGGVHHKAVGTQSTGAAGLGRANATTERITADHITTIVQTAVTAALAAQTTRPGPRPVKKEFKPTKYCWTHGYNTNHMSHQCRKSAKGHITNATTHLDREGANDANYEAYKSARANK